ncbi:Hypothetical predicted protein [Mytilus galloprovincialis]|uniref:2'-phosphotransferase n=1 Tax=Mytilus galloprovincialis TaxID=29158 RepID=A0A8B6BLA3_MYTGA|nr:Hypothetical predicted protein [Mytilus galloprovincialis]
MPIQIQEAEGLLSVESEGEGTQDIESVNNPAPECPLEDKENASSDSEEEVIQDHGVDRHLSKTLIYVLRHGASKWGLKVLPGGFVYVDELLSRHPGLSGYTLKELTRLVESVLTQDQGDPGGEERGEIPGSLWFEREDTSLAAVAMASYGEPQGSWDSTEDHSPPRALRSGAVFRVPIKVQGQSLFAVVDTAAEVTLISEGGIQVPKVCAPHPQGSHHEYSRKGDANEWVCCRAREFGTGFQTHTNKSVCGPYRGRHAVGFRLIKGTLHRLANVRWTAAGRRRGHTHDYG